MLSKWLVVTCLFIAPLSAEVIGDVEYQLPEQGQNWKIGNRIDASKQTQSTTIIYIPNNVSMNEAKDFFGVHRNNLPGGPIDQGSVEKVVQIQFPNFDTSATILEKDLHSVLYEWSVKDEGQEKVHGWNRIFTFPHETVILMYQTEQMDSVEDFRKIWIPLLKDAGVKKAAVKDQG